MVFHASSNKIMVIIPIGTCLSLFLLPLIAVDSSAYNRIISSLVLADEDNRELKFNYSSHFSLSNLQSITKVTTTTSYESNPTTMGNNISDKNRNHNNINHPFVSPNPVGKSGQIKVSANFSDNIGIARLTMDIEGPNLGLSSQNFTLPKVGSLTFSLVSGGPKSGTWVGLFTFPEYLPDGNYLYSFISADNLGNTKIIGPFSGIILDRYPPGHQDSQARIISAVDGDNKNVPNNGTTYSRDMTFTFEGRENTGLVLFMQCNLDDTLVQGEHGEEHGADVNTPKTTYSTCFVADKIARQATGNHSYTGLGVGNHTFKVKVIDNEYNVGAIPAVFNWTILPKT